MNKPDKLKVLHALNKLAEVANITEDFVGQGCRIIVVMVPDHDNDPSKIAIVQSEETISVSPAILQMAAYVQTVHASEEMDQSATTETSNAIN